jgi:hypothetical protein
VYRVLVGGPVHGLAWSGPNRAANLWSGSVDLLTKETPLITGRLSGVVNSGVATTAFSRDGRMVAAAGEKRLLLQEAAQGIAKPRAVVVPSALTGVAWSSTNLIAAGGEDGLVRLFEPAGEKEKAALAGHKGEVRCVAFSSDGKLLASGGVDGTVRVWDPAECKELHRLEGHTQAVLVVAFAPGGKVLASGGADGVVRLHDAQSGKELAVLPARTAEALVTCVAFSPDGKTLAAALEREVRRWDVAEITGGGGR